MWFNINVYGNWSTSIINILWCLLYRNAYQVTWQYNLLEPCLRGTPSGFSWRIRIERKDCKIEFHRKIYADLAFDFLSPGYRRTVTSNLETINREIIGSSHSNHQSMSIFQQLYRQVQDRPSKHTPALCQPYKSNQSERTARTAKQPITFTVTPSNHIRKLSIWLSLRNFDPHDGGDPGRAHKLWQRFLTVQAHHTAKRNSKIAISIANHLISGPTSPQSSLYIYKELPSFEPPVGDYLKIVMRLKPR